MAKRYIFAIDETGSFRIRYDKYSFVCGVLIDGSENDLRGAYKKTYEDFGFPLPAPNSVADLLTKDPNDDNDKARFHFAKLSDEEKGICQNNLLPFVRRIYKSKGTPLIYANNQNWWLIAVIVVIRNFLKETKFEPNSEIEVWIDNRDAKVWGTGDCDINGKVPEEYFRSYHEILKSQIEKSVKNYLRRDCKLNMQFLSDTSSFYINLADITCGFVSKGCELLSGKVTECPCHTFMDDSDPMVYLERNPAFAYSLIMQEIANNNFKNISHLANLLGRLRSDKDNYTVAWDIFRDMVKFKINERRHKSNLIETKPVVNIFKQEISKDINALDSNRKLDIMVLLMEYYSHIGDSDVPFERNLFVEELKKVSDVGETRILRKWELLIRYSFREAQILFNNYCFDEVNSSFEKLCDAQERLIQLLTEDVFVDMPKKDEHTTAIFGTMAQSYAYNGDYQNALDYCELSKEYAIKTSSHTDSYMFCIYHRLEDVDNCRIAFKNQTGLAAEEYAERQDFSDQWKLLSYCKLVALELYKNNCTNLPIPVDFVLASKNEEYPFPLIQKWTAIAMCLQNIEADRAQIEKLLNRACGQLLNDKNGFVIKTLALPVIQCYSVVNNQNPYHAKYAGYLNECKKASSCFSDFVDKKAAELNSIKNNADIWQRAMLLPFIYS